MSSLGWLTESALIPKPAKKIVVNNTSTVDLQAMLQNEKNKVKKKFVNKEVKNKGVELRNKLDIDKQVIKADYKRKLEEKSKLYEKLLNEGTNADNIMIDFQQKKWDGESKEEKQEFEIERQKFYQKKKQELVDREQNLLYDIKTSKLKKNIDQSEIERVQWERQMINEIEKGLTQEMMDAEKEKKNLVKQSYDAGLTKNEKEGLKDVLKDQALEKQNTENIKRKRQELIELRKQKLLKFA